MFERSGIRREQVELEGPSEHFAFLLRHFHTVWVKAPPEMHMKRVIEQGDERPMAGNPKAMEELAQYDGQVPVRPTQFGCAGYVYDVSRLFMWMTGRHFRLQAGRDWQVG